MQLGQWARTHHAAAAGLAAAVAALALIGVRHRQTPMTAGATPAGVYYSPRGDPYNVAAQTVNALGPDLEALQRAITGAQRPAPPPTLPPVIPPAARASTWGPVSQRYTTQPVQWTPPPTGKRYTTSPVAI